jgi:ankyrin repeat protein
MAATIPEISYNCSYNLILPMLGKLLSQLKISLTIIYSVKFDSIKGTCSKIYNIMKQIMEAKKPQDIDEFAIVELQDVPVDPEEFLVAVKNGDIKKVRRFLRLGGNVNHLYTGSDDSALMISCKTDNIEMVEMLINDRNISMTMNKLGCTPLNWVAGNGRTKIASIILSHPNTDVNVCNVNDTDMCSPILWAAKYGHISMIELLLATKNIDVNKRNLDGYTALHWAAIQGHLVITKLLLQAPDIDVNAVDCQKRTALSIAICSEHSSIVDVLSSDPRVIKKH